MQFVKTNIGLVNLAFVESIQRGSDGKTILRLANSFAICDTGFEEMDVLVGDTIPNTTGAQALFMDVDDGKVSHWLGPIVAWRIVGTDAIPVLTGGDECNFILLPSGQVDELYIGLFDTIDDAKADFLNRQKR
jgi:hypothetical protein